jgi:hypothetical protein
MEVMQMPRGAVAATEHHATLQAVETTNPALPAPPSKQIRDAIEAGVVSRRLLFPENSPPRRVETWRAPVIKDKAVGAAIWSRLKELDVWLSPAPRPALMSRILVLLAHYRSTTHADAVEQGVADDWAEDLAAYPMWAIDEAARTWRRTRKFKPQISEIIELCEAARGSLALEHKRLQAMVDAASHAANPLSVQVKILATCMLKPMS